MKAARRRKLLRELTIVELAIAATAIVVALLIAAGFGGRFAVLTPWGRDVVSSLINGRQLGRYGRINVHGLRGDLWRDFTFDRVTVTDPQGVWLDARNVHLRWRSGELLLRRFHAENAEAQVVTFIRRPVLSPEITPPGPMSLSFRIDKASATLDLLEGFSQTYGRWTATGSLDLERRGTKAVGLDARSLSRPGDFARLTFSGGDPKKPLVLDAQASEAKGGPIAGALGYSPRDPFVLTAQAHGRPGDGRLDAVVRSGGYTPLVAAGFWNKARAVASGRIVFAGSSLMAPYSAHIGPEARFGLAARPARDGRWGLAWAVNAENFTGHGQGPFDFSTRTSKEGISIDAETASLTRLVGKPVAGAARWSGLATGGLSSFRLKGQALLSKAGLGGYELGQVTAPVDALYRNGRWDVVASAKGAGGAGSGWIAGLLGARPTAEAKLTALPDGRVFLQRFNAQGSALQVAGQGGENLMGGLNFNGRAAITNLGGLRGGASGEVAGPVQASQARAGQPWKLAFDIRGRKVVTGLGQLDRLLGREPELKASGDLARNRVTLASAVLSGASSRVDAKGLVGLDGALKLDLDWRAKGPFEAGPVELAGDVNGSGALTGSIGAPRADLKARLSEIDVGRLTLTQSDVALTFAKDLRGYDGHIALVAASAWGPARGASDFRFAPNGVRLDGLDVDAGGVKAKGSLALSRGSPSSADLTFAAGPGAFLSSGHAQGLLRLADGAQATAAAVQITGTDLALRGEPYVFHTIKLAGQGTSQRLPFTLTTDASLPTPVKFSGTGVYSRSGASQTVALDGSGSVRAAAFKTLKPLIVAFSGPNRTLDADVSMGGGTLLARAVQTAGRFDARAGLSGVDLGAVNRDLVGKVDGNLVLTGAGKSLGGSFDGRLSGLRPRLGPKKLLVEATLKAVLANGRLRLDAQAFDQGGTLKGSANLDLPVVASAAPLHLAVVKTQPFSGRYDFNGEVQPIWNLFLGGDRSLSGQVASRGDLAGTLDNPRLVGSAAVTGGKFADAATGLSLRNLTLDAGFDGPSAVVRSFSATDAKGGKVTGEGRIDLAKGGASSLTLQLADFQLVDNDYIVGRATGPVKVTRAADGKLTLTGRLDIDRADIQPKLPNASGVVGMDVVEINAPPGRRSFEAPEKGPSAALDVTLHAARGVFVKGRGLNVEFALDAHVGGTTADPVLSGDAHVTRGDFDFAGQRFTFDERGVVRLSTHPEEITLDLRAVRDNPTLVAVIEVRGVAAHPEISLTSEPALPQDEVLSQVLFGTSASQLSPVEAAQLGSAVASLSGGGGLDVLGNLRNLAGLDRLVIAGDAATGGLTVGAGKYVSDNVYLELIGGGKDAEAVQVEWRVKKSVSILSRIAGQGDAKLAIRWRKDLR